MVFVSWHSKYRLVALATIASLHVIYWALMHGLPVIFCADHFLSKWFAPEWLLQSQSWILLSTSRVWGCLRHVSWGLIMLCGWVGLSLCSFLQLFAGFSWLQHFRLPNNLWWGFATGDQINLHEVRFLFFFNDGLSRCSTGIESLSWMYNAKTWLANTSAYEFLAFWHITLWWGTKQQ